MDATSPLLPHPATQPLPAPAAPRGPSTKARRPRQPRLAASKQSRRQDDEDYNYNYNDVDDWEQGLEDPQGLDDGETAYARLRWAVATLIIAAFLAIILWLAVGGGATSAQDKCRNTDPGFPGHDQVGYAGPTPTVSTLPLDPPPRPTLAKTKH